MRKKRLSEGRKTAYRTYVRNKALLGFFIRHPDKMDDERIIGVLRALAAKQANAYIAFLDPKSAEAAEFKPAEKEAKS